MGKPDIYQSGYFEDRRRFADLVNGVLFGGRRLVKPEELQELESLFEFLRYSGEKELLEEKLRQNRERYSHLDEETVQLLSKLANVEKLEHIQEKGEGGIDMCKAWEDQKLEGIKEGIKEGKKEGRLELIRRIMENRKMSLEEVLEMIGMSEEERISCREEMAAG